MPEFTEGQRVRVRDVPSLEETLSGNLIGEEGTVLSLGDPLGAWDLMVRLDKAQHGVWGGVSDVYFHFDELEAI